MKRQAARGYTFPATIFVGILGRCQGCVAEDTAGSESNLLHVMAVGES